MDDKKVIVIVGPTASGKSEIAVQLAKKLNGEIISADSRQIYKGLDIGSGKVEGKWEKTVFVYKGIPHYLIDEASPRVQYSALRFQKKARAVIADIFARGKQPIICGGTGHWIDAVMFDQQFPTVKPNAKLRTKLGKLSATELFNRLKKLDPTRAATIDNKNPHRLIRALEIVMGSGKLVPVITSTPFYKHSVWIGLNPNFEALEKKIQKRLNDRLKQGMLTEVTNLRDQGLSWKKLESFGLEYKYCALYLQNQVSYPELQQQLSIAIRQYAKRQITWWKRNKNIRWYADASDAKKLLV